MRKRISASVGLLVVLLAGCDSKPKPIPIPMSERYNLNDGRYIVVVDAFGPITSTTNTHFANDGKGNEIERVEIIWGELIKLRIEDGKLTVNGKERGTLAKGDEIKVNAAGLVLVNGVER